MLPHPCMQQTRGTERFGPSDMGAAVCVPPNLIPVSIRKARTPASNPIVGRVTDYVFRFPGLGRFVFPHFRYAIAYRTITCLEPLPDHAEDVTRSFRAASIALNTKSGQPRASPRSGHLVWVGLTPRRISVAR